MYVPHHHRQDLTADAIWPPSASIGADRNRPRLVAAPKHLRGLDLFLRFFLLRVVRADLQLARRYFDANAAILFVRQNRRTLQ